MCASVHFEDEDTSGGESDSFSEVSQKIYAED